ncbi:MAG: PPC domain-containing protein [Planctomycetota bacterium]|nr:PPC domain-containing protein [Planctomycetota bacterium]
MKTALTRSGLFVLVCTVASAQGADDCSNAQVIAGLGPHLYDNTAATKDGPNDCAGEPARKDVWFKWTAPATGGYLLDTCGMSSFETRIMIYDDQPCPVSSSPIACAASGCNGLGTRFSFPTAAGQNYLIRVGAKAFNSSGTGAFALSFDNCWNLSDDNLEDNDTCGTALPLNNGLYPGLFVSKTDTDFYEFDVDDGAQFTADVLFLHALGDLDIFLYDSCGGTAIATSGSATNDEHIVWDNTTGACARVILEVQHWAPDIQSECQTYDMDINGAAVHGSCGPTGIGTNYCGPANLNSSGQPAQISAFGSVSVAANDVLLEATQMPSNQFGFFLNSMTQGFAMPPGSQGNLCLSGGIGRYNAFIMSTGATGEFSLQLDLTDTPAPGGHIAIQAGETWYFQTWFRDNNPSQTNNFTDGICIVFL